VALEDSILEPVHTFLAFTEENQHKVENTGQWQVVGHEGAETRVNKAGEVKLNLLAVSYKRSLFHFSCFEIGAHEHR
jgi:hypothetical protein